MKLSSFIFAFICYLPFIAPCQSGGQSSFWPNIAILNAEDAVMSTGLTKSPHKTPNDFKVFAIEGWRNDSQKFQWQFINATGGKAKVAMLIEIKGLTESQTVLINLSLNGRIISKRLSNTSWDKIFFADDVQLVNGKNEAVISMADISPGTRPELKLYSIEIIPEKDFATQQKLAGELKSRPAWLDNADYGLFFHWNARSKPRHGEPKSFEQSVKDFDVQRFATMVKSTGAKFIVLTTSWGGSSFPAPIDAVEKVSPGSTTTRDLIADLSAALSPYQIKLIIYCNYTLQRIGLEKKGALSTADIDRGFNTMISIYQEIASRYKGKIAGFWIDDGMILYPYKAPFDLLTKAMKHADTEMVVCYNSWIYPRFTEYQDFFGGEFGITMKAAQSEPQNLPIGGTGYFVNGGQQGLKATFCGQLEKGDWTHTPLNTAISSPVLNAASLIEIVKEGMKRKNTAILNVSVYQDGSPSPETLDLLHQLNQAISSK
jgi:hypothetical protein